MKMTARAVLLVLGLGLIGDSRASVVESSLAKGPDHVLRALKVNHGTGFYESAFDLKIETPVPGVEVFYTTNGALPGREGVSLYSAPIRIDTTTTVRACGISNGTAITPVVIRTYLFLSNVIHQTGEGLPPSWASNEGKAVPAYYSMSRSNATDRAFGERLLRGFKAIPSLCLTADAADLFAPDSGIYSHPLERGSEWERAAVAEMITPGGHLAFAIDCGLRIHGGWSRRPEESPKHSFRLLFRRRFGPPALRYRLFEGEGTKRFTALILRAGNNNTWLHPSAEERRRADYVRDEWMRSSMLAMGHPSARGLFVHLYLNGLYWGLYNLCEDPGPSLLSGGFKTRGAEFDLIKGDKVESGDRVAWDRVVALADSGLDDSARYNAFADLVDLNEFTDYLILNFYGGNSDWDRVSNWCAIRSRKPGGRFLFLVWDAERTLESSDANTLDSDDEGSPMRLFHKLSENAAYRRLFASRAGELLGDRGQLSPTPAAQRYQLLAAVIEKAVVAESARWGTYRRDILPFKTGPYEDYTVEGHWRPEINRLLNDYFPQRTRVLSEQLRTRDLFQP